MRPRNLRGRCSVDVYEVELILDVRHPLFAMENVVCDERNRAIHSSWSGHVSWMARRISVDVGTPTPSKPVSTVNGR